MSEVTLYNKKGLPIAYIADDEGRSIYLWSGHAVAYISRENVYGWNGNHLGWFVGGIIYDLKGLRVGFIQNKSPAATHALPAKYAKHAKYVKYARLAAHARAALSVQNSNQGLESFLPMGKI